MQIDQNITNKKNILKEKEMAFEIEKEENLKKIDDLDIQIKDVKRNFSESLITKKKVRNYFLINNIFSYILEEGS